MGRVPRWLVRPPRQLVRCTRSPLVAPVSGPLAKSHGCHSPQQQLFLPSNNPHMTQQSIIYSHTNRIWPQQSLMLLSYQSHMTRAMRDRTLVRIEYDPGNPISCSRTNHMSPKQSAILLSYQSHIALAITHSSLVTITCEPSNHSSLLLHMQQS